MKKVLIKLLKNRCFNLKPSGKSMAPFLLPNDMLTLKKISFGKVKVNDIVLCKKSNKYFIHRVLYKSNKYLITKGDANYYADGRINQNDIIARVYQIKRDKQSFRPEDIYLLQSTIYFKEIFKIKQLFEKKGIELVFLKGLPLHLYYQGSHPNRIYLDCDILISEKNCEEARDILIKQGYKQGGNPLSKIHDKLKKKQATEVSFNKIIHDFFVVFDIHYEITFMMPHVSRLNALYSQELMKSLTDEFISERKSVLIKNEKFYILSEDNLIIFLALHFFHHNLHGIYRLELLARIVEKIHKAGKLKLKIFERVKEKINRYNLQNFVYPSLVFLDKYYPLSLMSDLLKDIKPKKSKLKYITRNLLASDVFNEELRVGSGINRFRNFFNLSPSPFIKRLLVFMNISVMYLIFWVIVRRIKDYLRRSFSILKITK